MAQFEELKLQITLNDQASQGLREIQRLLASLYTGSDLNRLLNELKRVEQGIVSLQNTTAGLSRSMADMSRNLRAGYREVMAWQTAAIAAGYTIYNLGQRLSEFSRQTINLDVMARSAGVIPAQMKNITDQLQRLGYEAGHAQREVTQFYQTMTLALRGGSAEQERILRNAQNPEFVLGMLERWQKMADAGDFNRPIEEAADSIRATFQEALQRTGSRTQAAAAAKAYAEDLGLSLNIMDVFKLNEMTPAQVRAWAQREAAAKRWRDEWEKSSQIFKDFMTELQIGLLPTLEEVNRIIAEMGPGWSQSLAGAIRTMKDDLKPFIEFLTSPWEKGLEQIWDKIKEKIGWGGGGGGGGNQPPQPGFAQPWGGPKPTTPLDPQGKPSWLTPFITSPLSIIPWVLKGVGDAVKPGYGERQQFGELHPFEGINIPEEGRSSIWDLSGGYSTNVDDRREQTQATEEQSDIMKDLTAEIRRLNDYLMGNEALGFIDAAGNLRGGTGAGAGAPMGGGGPPSGGGGTPPTSGTAPDQTGPPGSVQAPAATPTSPVHSTPATLPGSVASTGYDPTKFTPVPDLMTPSGLPPQGDTVPSSTAPSAPGMQTFQGRPTWFLGSGNNYTYTDPKGNQWVDAGARANREGPFASGLPPDTPGIATPGREGLGQWYEVTLPDGRRYVTRKVDIGPSGVVDFSAAAAYEAFGSQKEAESVKGNITARPLGKTLPKGVQPGIQKPTATTAGQQPKITTPNLRVNDDAPYLGGGAAGKPGAKYAYPDGAPAAGKIPGRGYAGTDPRLFDPNRMYQPAAGTGATPGGKLSPITGSAAPTSGNVFGASRSGGHRRHSGIDLRSADGSDAGAITGGTVLSIGNDPGGYDHYAVVKGDDGIIRRYAYHGTTLVKQGQRVEAGTPLGKIARGHLHLESIPPTINGKPNPVYQEFLKNGNANTSHQRGVVDPLTELGIQPGQQLTRNQPLGGADTSQPTPPITTLRTRQSTADDLDRSLLSSTELRNVKSDAKVKVDVDTHDEPKQSGKTSLHKTIAIESKRQMADTPQEHQVTESSGTQTA